MQNSPPTRTECSRAVAPARLVVSVPACQAGLNVGQFRKGRAALRDPRDDSLTRHADLAIRQFRTPIKEISHVVATPLATIVVFVSAEPATAARYGDSLSGHFQTKMLQDEFEILAGLRRLALIVERGFQT